MRITTSMIAKQYARNTRQAQSELNRRFNQMSTFRAFDAPSDDPFAAAQTFQIRSQYDRNTDYKSNLSNVLDFFHTADSSLVDINTQIAEVKSTSGVKGINGGMNEKNRGDIATVLRQTRDAILAQMNAQFGGQYLFGGAGDPGSPPFTVDGAGNLLYHGVNVDTGKNSNGASATINYTLPGGAAKSMQLNFGKSIDDKLDGYSVKIATNTSASAGSENISAIVDKGTKTITLNINNSPSKSQTKQDLQNFLQSGSFENDLKNGFSFTSADMAGITVGGNVSDVLSGNPSSLSWGAGIGSSLNGYQVVYDGTATGPGATVDAANKKITISYKSGTTTVGALQTFLRTDSTFQSQLNTATAFSGDVKQITISGLPDNGSDALRDGQTAAGNSISSYVNLDDLANEKVFADIGLGLQTDANGNVLNQSAFNSSLPGIQFIGYGTDPKTGVPKNIYSLLTVISNKLENFTSNDNQKLMDDLDPYLTSLTNAEENFSTQQADVGSKEKNFLTPMSTYLDNVDLNLQSKDQNVEYVDPSTAITNYYMQLMSWNAALKAGNEVLQPTLMDFMR